MLEAVKRFAQNQIQGKPLYVSIEPTWVCNADCDFCDHRRSDPKEPRLQGIASYRNIIAFLNPVVTTFAGGEPLLRPDLEKLVREVKETGVPVIQVTTNGSSLSVDRYIALSKAGVDNINISIDFADKRHDTYRGIIGLSERIFTFLEATRNVKGAKLNLNVIYMKDNSNSIPTLLKIARQRGISVGLIPYTSIRSGVHEHEFDKENRFASMILEEFLTDYRDVLICSDTYFENLRKYLSGNLKTKCEAGKYFMWVLPDGRITPCNLIGEDAPRISVENYEEALKKSLAFAEKNACQACYMPCRGETEINADVRPLQLIRNIADFTRRK